MFTVRYKDERGNEHLFEAVEVQRIAVKTAASTEPDSAVFEPGVVIVLPNGSALNIKDTNGAVKEGDQSREVFVLNAEGKTVSRYPL